MSYRLTLTEEQIQVVRDALNVYFRLGLGQIRDALDELPHGDKPRDWSRWHEDVVSIRTILGPHMGLSASIGHSYGVTNPLFAVRHRVAHDVHDAIRHRMAWDAAYARGDAKPGEPRNWQTMMGCHFDEVFKVAELPLPVVEKVQDA